jgi:hypothetical protein
MPEQEVMGAAREILRTSLLENFLLIDGRSLESGGMSLSEPIPLDRDKAQKGARTVSKGISTSFAVVAQFDTSKVIDAFELHRLRCNHKRRKDLDRCIELLHSGYGLSDPADKLESFWKSFNILYGCLENWERQSARSSINNLLNSYPREREVVNGILERHAGAMNELVNAELAEWNSGKSYSMELRDSLRTANYRSQLRWAILCVYLVRNEIVHKCESLEEKHPFYTQCSSFLFDLVRSILLSIFGL